MFLFADDNILYVKKISKNLPKIKTIKILEVMSNYSKVARYKDNIQKPIALLYSSNEQMKYMCISLTKYVLYIN